MFDVKKGEIYLLKNDITINPHLKKDHVLRSQLYSQFLRDEADMNNSYFWFYFKPIKILETQVSIGMCFQNENIFMVHMMINGKDFPNSWSDWSEAKELERKEAHDLWLQKNIGKPPYIYKWGKISSVYDNKGGFSVINILFQTQ